MNQGYKPKLRREATCKYCLVPFSPAAMTQACEKAPDKRHNFQMVA